MLVDTHCHLDFESYDGDRDAVVARAAAAGVRRIIVPATDLEGCRTVLALADQYEGVYAAVGVHPNSAAGWSDIWIDALRELAGHPKVVAVGEIGLDYYRDRTPMAIQEVAFAAQLALAAELRKPVIVHNRQADQDVLRLLAESALAGQAQPGVLHSFASSWDVAAQAVDMGFYLGFTGPVTYKKADEMRAVAAKMPFDRLLVETDGPFLTPQAHRGERNEPAYVRLVAEKIAELRRLPLAAIAGLTTENAARLFGRDAIYGT